MNFICSRGRGDQKVGNLLARTWRLALSRASDGLGGEIRNSEDGDYGAGGSTLH